MAIIISVILLFIVIFSIVAAYNGFMLRGARNKYFKALLGGNFKAIDSNSYVVKSNRFGDVVCKDFLALMAERASVVSGVIRYNADESVVFGDWNLSVKLSGKGKERKLLYTGIVHLRKTPLPGRVKIFSSALTVKKNIFAVSLPVVLGFQEMSDFVISSDMEFKKDMFMNDFSGLLQNTDGAGASFFADNPGIIIVSPQGWLILTPYAAVPGQLDAILNIDQKVFDCLIKKNV